MSAYDHRYQGRVAEKTCPHCGKKRPLDWFGPEFKDQIVDARTGKVTKVVRYRKYVACWRCRWIHRITTRLYGNDLIGEIEEKAVFADDLIG